MKNKIIENINKSVNPYYIYTPSYVNSSAGVKVLHLLCHHLNLKGYPAFLVKGYKTNQYKINTNLITPILDEYTISQHNKNKKVPIVIYPDIVSGNPLKSICNVRYLLHYAGFLGGDSTFNKDEIVFTYTKKIAEKLGLQNVNTLFMPIPDTNIFFPPEKEERKGSCYYASKYRLLSGNKKTLIENSVEITRDLPDSQSTKEVAELLRKSETFYCYEDSSLITESILCGCPVVLVENEFFDGKTLASYEIGEEGMTSIKEGIDGLKKAKESIKSAQENFIKSTEIFHPQLINFINLTQDLSQKFDYKNSKIILPKKTDPIGRRIKRFFKSLF